MSQAFLVLLRCPMDDLPVRLFTDEHFAVMTAEILARDISKAREDGVAWPAEVENSLQVLGLDVGGVCNVSILTFTDGVPSGIRLIEDLT